MVEAVDQQYNPDSLKGSLVSLLDTNPNPISVQGRTTGPARRSTKGGWTEEEDKKLVAAVKKYHNRNWRKIAECVPCRTDVQCLHRWQKVLNPALVKGPWTKEEDDLIVELVGKQGNRKWSEIAKHLPGRIGKQCRERWQNHLNPNIKRTKWTKEEETILMKAHAIYGNKWVEISKFLQGRTENSIKNHWNCSLRKKLESDRNCDSVQHSDGHSLAKEMDFNFSLPDSLDLELGLPTAREVQLPTSEGGIFKFPRNESMAGIGDDKCKESDGFKYSNERTRKPSKTVNSLHPTAVSVPWTLSLSTPSVPDCDNKRDQLPDTNKRDGLEEMNHGFSSYELLKLNDLNTFLETGGFPSTDSYINAAGSPVSCFTPASHSQGIHPDCNSPESVWKSTLRRAASSFKHTPSIIRKRNSKTSSQSTGNDVCLSEDHADTSCNSHQCQQLVLSPSKSQKLEASFTTKWIEKRLEYAFNAECD